MPKQEITFPTNITEKNVYITITMRTLSHQNALNELVNRLTDIDMVSTAKDILNKVSTILKSDSDTEKEEYQKQLEKKKAESKKHVSKSKYNGTDVFDFHTYIPSNFGIDLMANWSEAPMFSMFQSFEKGLSSLPLGVGNLISTNLTMLKSEAQYLTNTAITPREIKLYQPSFGTFTLDFEFKPNNKEESDALMNMIRTFRAGQIPKMKDGNHEIFEFPAVFAIKIQQNDENGSIKKNSRITELYDHFTKFNDLGMTSFKVQPMNGENKYTIVRKDGTYLGYQITMEFTTLNKIYDVTSVQERLNNIFG